MRFRVSLLLTAFIIFNSIPVKSQDTIAADDSSTLTMIFIGDIMGHDSQIEGAFDSSSRSYNYEPTFRYITDYISAADIAIANLEVTLGGPPYKGYPAFSSPDELGPEIKNSGIDILVTANNHALDRGKAGFLRTLDMLDSLGFYRAGTYRDSLEQASIHPLIFEKDSIRFALLNYTYGTNGLKIGTPCLINRIDTARIANDLLKAKLADPDYIIVFIHWGNEYERVENATQKGLARFLIKNGADAVIGSHPHVVQPIQYLYLSDDSLTAHPVVYSLGNFVSNQRAQYKDGGVIAELHFSRKNQNVRLDSLCYLPYWVWRQDKDDGKSTFYVLPVSKYEMTPEDFELLPGDIYRLNRFATDTRKHLENAKESSFYLQNKVE